MAASTSPIFASTSGLNAVQWVFGSATQSQVRTGVTSSYTVGTDMLTLITGSASGTRIDRVTVTADGTVAISTAAKLLLWIYKGSGNYFLYKEMTIAAATPSASAVGATSQIIIPGGLIIPVGWTLCGTITVVDSAGNQWSVVIEGGNF